MIARLLMNLLMISSTASSTVSAIVSAREVALKNTKRQAEKILTRSRHKCPHPVVGSTVQLPIPEVDQGPLDTNHVLCCVVEIEKEKCLKKLGNKHSLIDTLFPVNGFSVCKQILINILFFKHIFCFVDQLKQFFKRSISNFANVYFMETPKALKRV